MKASVYVTQCVVIFAGLLFFSATVLAQGSENAPNMSVDAKAKTEAIDMLVKDLREYYVFPDAGDKMAKMLEERQKRGEYNSIVDAREFGDLLTKQMYEVSSDKHLTIEFSPSVIPPDPVPGTEQPMVLNKPERLSPNNWGFAEVKLLDGNLGYLKMTSFSRPAWGGPIADAAMTFLSNTYALIIDLRESHGGDPAMAQLLASYLFNGVQPVHLNDLAYRKPGTSEYVITQWWVLPHVPGPRYLGREVYVLTSNFTFSAAEEFTYDLQALKRATIVGQATRGGAHPVSGLRLGEHFRVRMPEGRAINPITNTDWEGVGIKPDIEAPIPDALKVAEKMGSKNDKAFE